MVPWYLSLRVLKFVMVWAASVVPVYAVSGGTRKYLFIPSSLHRPFGGCFLLQAAKLVEVRRSVVEPSLDERSGGRRPAKSGAQVCKVRLHDRGAFRWTKAGVTTRRELLGSFVGRRREQRQLDRKHLRVDADCKSDADEKRKVNTPNFSLSPSLSFRVCLSSRSCARFRAVFFGLGVSLVCFSQAEWQRALCVVGWTPACTSGFHS